MSAQPKSWPEPPDEAQRVAALREYRVLDTAPEQGFDDLTQLAALVSGQPIALISLVDARRQWFMSRVGLRTREAPRSVAFCAHTILGSEPLIVEDTTLDARFATNPLVTGHPALRFYAGFPLLTGDGAAIGTLCVMGLSPASLAPHQIDALLRLSRQVMSQLELKRAGRDARETARSAERSAERAQRLANARAAFLAAIGQEMFAPLNSLLGLCDLLIESAPAPTEAVLGRDMRTVGDQLRALLDTMLDLSGLVDGRVALDHAPLDLAGCVHAVFDACRPIAEAKGIALVLAEAPEAVSRRYGDAKRVRQILGYLLDNAVRFTQRGQVRVTLTAFADGCGREAVRIAVTDTGIGMSPELVARVSEKVAPASDAGATRYTGLGIGLTSTRLIVRAMAGSLAVQSVLGVGSTFSVALPLPARGPDGAAR